MSLAALGLLARWAHLGLSVAVLGSAAALLVAGRSTRPTALGWEARVLGQARGLAILALVTGALTVAYQAANLTGRLQAAFDARTLGQVLLDTQAGHVWLLRIALLLLLLGFLGFRADARQHADWLAARGQALGLAGVALALVTAGGHAAAVKPGGLAAMTIDAAHLVATGLWIGALLPLGLLLRAASQPEGADARPQAVRAVRRFSRLALVMVLVLAATGAGNAAIQVASVAGLVGTPYGQLLLAKLALLIPILLVAAVNRRRLLPELPGDAATVGRPAMRRLAAFMAAEAALALIVLGLAAALALTPPARHLQPTWPFAFRLDLAVLDSAPHLRLQALLGS
ncbi:MAG TPA: CopD family protein, partial [Methylomirabilota bacterium]|nr:CopD family protein [Methylomirabilota bacterium]